VLEACSKVLEGIISLMGSLIGIVSSKTSSGVSEVSEASTSEISGVSGTSVASLRVGFSKGASFEGDVSNDKGVV